MKKKKKHSSTPRRKNYYRKQRLPKARIWLKTFKGKNVVKSYARWFGVDQICAMTELRILGVEISADHEERIHQALADKIHQKRLRKQKKENGEREQETFPGREDSNEGFDFIAGYTSNDVPFGIRLDEVITAKNDKQYVHGTGNE